MQDFNYHFSNAVELTFELSCCKYPPVDNLTREWQNNRQAILTFLEMAHMGIRGKVTNSTTGKPIEGQSLWPFLMQPDPPLNSFFFIGALIHVWGINHPVRTTKVGEFWRLLMPGTHHVRVTHPPTKTASSWTKVIVDDVSKKKNKRSLRTLRKKLHFKL